MTHNLRFPPAPRHSSEDDFLEHLGPAWSKMSTEEKRLYGGPITLAREAAEDAATTAIADGRGITTESVRDLLDVTTRFPRAARSEGLLYVAQKWCTSEDAVALAALLDGTPMTEEVQTGPYLVSPVDALRIRARHEHRQKPRARGLKVG